MEKMAKNYTIELTLKSDALIGSGEGYGAIIDSDIVFDDLGIPYIPAKRIKGCLRASADELSEIFRSAKIDYPVKISKTFGCPGQKQATPVYFSNLVIKEYEKSRKWLEYLTQEYSAILSKESILSTFTEIRQQTAIDEKEGVADEHSLRTIRVLKKGLTFSGEVLIEDDSVTKSLALACLNLRHLGTKRNRGFGEVEVKLLDGANSLSDLALKELEEVCRSSPIG